MLWLLSLFLLGTPQGTVTGLTVPPALVPLYQASVDLSSGQEALGLARIKLVLDSGTEREDSTENVEPTEHKAARLLLVVHHTCSGNLQRAGGFWNHLSPEEKRLLALLFLGKRVISLRPTLTGDALWNHVDGILGVYTRCQPGGVLFFADYIYNITKNDADRRALFEWLPSLFTGDELPNPESYTGIGIYFILANRRLRHHWLNEPMSNADLEKFQHLFENLNLMHPYPSGTPWRISALIPLTGAWSPLGLQMLQALSAARTALPALEIIVHNTNSSPGTTLTLFQEEVLLKDRPLAVLLPPDPESAKAVLDTGARIPFLSSGDGLDLPVVPGAFFAQPTRKTRVAALIDAGFIQKATRFGILFPDTVAGKELQSEAIRMIKARKGELVFSSSYNPAKLPDKLSISKLKDAQAILIPDAADRVAALARRLAAAGAFPSPLTEKGGGPLLLATAEALSPATVAGNIRYFNGAIFACGFYPDAPDSEFLPLTTHFATMRNPMVLSIAAETYAWIRALPLSAVRSAGDHSLLTGIIARWSLGPGLGRRFDDQGRTLARARLYRLVGGKMQRIP